jgi:hypothetical protein
MAEQLGHDIHIRENCSERGGKNLDAAVGDASRFVK